MRFLGVDFGGRRLGLALSDATGLIARPWRTIAAAASPAASAEAVAALLAGAGAAPEAAEVGAIVVGLPRRLNGDDTDQTAPARAFAAALADRTGRPVHLQDERLTSREAESRLARTEPDWRARKAHIDAMAAGIILQDFLDGRPPEPAGDPA
ncbi:MAG: Holliday junction resolvase RuvX [Vicinamibacterales bacterium]